MNALDSVDLFSRTEISQKMGLKLNQFDYLVRQLKYQPFKRVGNKHALVLYTQIQLEELNFALNLKNSGHTFETIIKIIELARNTNYQSDICAISFEDEILVCNLKDLPEKVLDLASENKKFSVETFLLSKDTNIDYLKNFNNTFYEKSQRID